MNRIPLTYLLFILWGFSAFPMWSQPCDGAALLVKFESGMSAHAQLVYGKGKNWEAFTTADLPEGSYVVNGHHATDFVDGRSFSKSLQLCLPPGDTLYWGVLCWNYSRSSWIEGEPVVLAAGQQEVLATDSVSQEELSTVLLHHAPDGVFAALWLIMVLIVFGRNSRRPSTDHLPLEFGEHHRIFRLAPVVAWAMVVFLVAGTWAFITYYRGIGRDWSQGGWIKHLLIHGNLGTENVLAVGLSSFLLFGVGILALAIGGPFSRTSHWVVRVAWIILGLGFVALSADELGSLHERVLRLLQGWGSDSSDLSVAATGTEDSEEGSSFASRIVIAGLVIIVPIGIAIWVRLRKFPLAMWLFVLGVACILSVPVQESFEMSQVKAASGVAMWQRPIWQILLEEGSELVGMACLFTAFSLWISYWFRNHGRFVIGRRDLAVAGYWVMVLLALSGLGILFSKAVLEYFFAVGDTGRLSFWFPAIGYLLAAGWSVLMSGLPDPEERQAGIAWRFAMLLMTGYALYFGGNLRIWGDSIDLLGVPANMAIEGGFTLALALLAWNWFRIQKRFLAAGFGVAGIISLFLVVLDPVVVSAVDVLIPSLIIGASLFQLSSE